MAEKNNSGFVKVPYEMLKILSPRELQIYCILLHFDSMKNGARPSFKTIAREIGKSRRGVIRVVDSLMQRGIIKISKRRVKSSGRNDYMSNSYSLKTKLPSDKNVTTPSDKNVTTPSDKNVTQIRLNNNKNEMNKREREEKTPLAAADLSPASLNLNHPENIQQVITEAKNRGVDISETQAQDFIDRYEVVAINGTWIVGKNNACVKDWRKLITSRWVENWKKDIESDNEIPDVFRRLDIRQNPDEAIRKMQGL